jgi:hypothetical protein
MMLRPEKRGKKRGKILLDAARPVLADIEAARIKEDCEGPLFRPMTPDATRLIRRRLDRKTPWRLVKKYCRAAGIDPDRLGARGIGIHSPRRTAVNDAISNGATVHEVREFAGYVVDHTTLFRAKGGRRRSRRTPHPDPPHRVALSTMNRPIGHSTTAASPRNQPVPLLTTEARRCNEGIRQLDQDCRPRPNPLRHFQNPGQQALDILDACDADEPVIEVPHGQGSRSSSRQGARRLRLRIRPRRLGERSQSGNVGVRGDDTPAVVQR